MTFVHENPKPTVGDADSISNYPVSEQFENAIAKCSDSDKTRLKKLYACFREHYSNYEVAVRTQRQDKVVDILGWVSILCIALAIAGGPNVFEVFGLPRLLVKGLSMLTVILSFVAIGRFVTPTKDRDKPVVHLNKMHNVNRSVMVDSHIAYNLFDDFPKLTI